MIPLKISLQAVLLLSVCCMLCACRADDAEVILPGELAVDLEKEDLIWQGESRDDGWRCEGACGDPNGIADGRFFVRITAGDGSLFQEIVLSAESRMMPTGMARWEDVNFDGEQDVLVHLGGGRGGAQNYAAVLWDETAGAYREEPAYAQIEAPIPDPAHGTVWGGTDASFQLDLTAWEFLDRELVQTHKLWMLYDFSAGEQCPSYIEYERENGAMAEIRHLMMQDGLQGIDAYISEYAEWEGWTWCPVQRFQQKG